MIVKYDHGNDNATETQAPTPSPLRLGFSTVGDLMTPAPVSMTPDTRVGDAARRFREQRIGHIPVATSGFLQGILSDRDVLRHLAANGGGVDAPIEQVMTPDPITIEPTDLVSEAIAKLMRHKVHCLPVIEGDRRIVGILTTTDLIRALYATVMVLERQQPATNAA
jgi:CBS domain-containing protein